MNVVPGQRSIRRHTGLFQQRRNLTSMLRRMLSAEGSLFQWQCRIGTVGVDLNVICEMSA